MARRVFISYQKKDKRAKNLLRMQGGKNSKIDLNLNDQSPSKPFSNKWKTQMKKRIEKASATVVMIGKDTHKSKAVQWEIEQSRKVGNKIVGVQIHKGKHHRTPSALRKREELKRWKVENIKRRINKRK
jgi:hypothetical protein